MAAGEKRRIWVPADLAYGDAPRVVGQPAGDLVYDLELLAIMAAPPVPEDVAAAPQDAKKTKSGLTYKVLEEGQGNSRPGPRARSPLLDQASPQENGRRLR